VSHFLPNLKVRVRNQLDARHHRLRLRCGSQVGLGRWPRTAITNDVTSYDYDLAGRLTTVRQEGITLPGAGSPGVTTTYLYDAAGDFGAMDREGTAICARPGAACFELPGDDRRAMTLGMTTSATNFTAMAIVLLILFALVALPMCFSRSYRVSLRSHLRDNLGWIVAAATLVIFVSVAVPSTDRWGESLQTQVIARLGATAYLVGVMGLTLRWMHRNHPDAWAELSEPGLIQLSKETRKVAIRVAVVVAMAAILPLMAFYLLFPRG